MKPFEDWHWYNLNAPHSSRMCSEHQGNTSQALRTSKFAIDPISPLSFLASDERGCSPGVKLNLLLSDQLENYSAHEIR